MRVVPVIDILNETVVHAKGGERAEYAPVDSVLSSSPDPIDVIDAFESIFDFKEIYIADLDAIQGRSPDISLLKRIGENTETEIMVDAGVDSVSKARSVIDAGVNRVVVGSETLREIADLREILREIGRNKVLASVDVREGKVISKCRDLSGRSPEDAAGTLEDSGVRELIVLELKRVGSERGPPTSMIEEVLDRVHIPVMVGGGIKNIENILELKEMGVADVLIATALHKGTITKKDLTCLRN